MEEGLICKFSFKAGARCMPGKGMGWILSTCTPFVSQMMVQPWEDAGPPAEPEADSEGPGEIPGGPQEPNHTVFSVPSPR